MKASPAIAIEIKPGIAYETHWKGNIIVIWIFVVHVYNVRYYREYTNFASFTWFGPELTMTHYLTDVFIVTQYREVYMLR